VKKENKNSNSVHNRREGGKTPSTEEIFASKKPGGTSMDEKKKQGSEVEAAGSLTPELSGSGHSHAHPFRYAGQEPNGSLTAQERPSQEE
jgi:hypothetical protein